MPIVGVRIGVRIEIQGSVFVCFACRIPVLLASLAPTRVGDMAVSADCALDLGGVLLGGAVVAVSVLRLCTASTFNLSLALSSNVAIAVASVALCRP